MKRILAGITITLILGFGACARATVTGQWDFNSSNLVATAGTDLAYRGDTESVTTFTAATIGGSNAIVMAFPATTVDQGYTMTHNIAPNGGSGSYVNQYTLIMDIMFPSASSDVYRALWQTSQENVNDADLFVGTGNGIGISSTYDGAILPDTWHRVAFVFDLTLSTDRLKKYIDGTLVGMQSITGLDGRWSLDPTALVFTDEDNETAAGFVNSIQIHDKALSLSEISALGGPTAAGIPILVVTNVAVTVMPTNQTSAVVGMAATPFTASADGPGTLSYQWYRNGEAVPGQTTARLVLSSVQSASAGSYTVIVNNGTQFATSSPPAVVTVEAAPPTFLTGQWDFNQGDLRATVGQPLQHFDATVQADTSFGTTTLLGVSDIAGQPANVMFCNPGPSTIGVTNWGGFVMPHGIGPNGGGTNANQYTVILDLFYWNWTSGNYRALWQTTPQNTNDADAFFNGGNGLGISQQYDGELILDNWHRVVLTYDLTRREFGKYIDGTNVLAAPTGEAPVGSHHVQYLGLDPDPTADGGVDMRWSMGPTALLLADGAEDGEVQPVYVSSVQVRSGRMTDAAISALGTPTANKIPAIPTAIQVRLSGTSVVIDWTGTVLESVTNLVTGSWSDVAGAAHPYVIASPTGAQFFRVKQ